jgi:hypothetical protein
MIDKKFRHAPDIAAPLEKPGSKRAEYGGWPNRHRHAAEHQSRDEDPYREWLLFGYQK